MKTIKIIAVTLLFVVTAPTVVSAISSFYNIDCTFLCCEKPTEEEKKENKSEKEIDDIEEYTLSKFSHFSSNTYNVCSYPFEGRSFIDIVSDIVTPPPEA